MHAVKETIQCSRCGCIALPDATKCPKCGAPYNGDRMELAGLMSYLTDHGAAADAGSKVVRAYYELTCCRHGRIHVKASVIGSSVKCPFC